MKTKPKNNLLRFPTVETQRKQQTQCSDDYSDTSVLKLQLREFAKTNKQLRDICTDAGSPRLADEYAYRLVKIAVFLSSPECEQWLGDLK